MDLLWWHAHWPYRLQQKITAVANKTAMTIHTLFFKPRIEERIKRGNSSTLQFISSHCDDECCFIFRALAMLFVTGTFFGCLFIVDQLLYVFKQVFPAEWSQINTYISFLPFFLFVIETHFVIYIGLKISDSSNACMLLVSYITHNRIFVKN